MKHNLEIRICTELSLEQVELLKDYLFDCIVHSSVLEPGTVLPEQVDLIVTDSE
jgi:late competence protein required for DNA uptake (superfamily II DNA/RNA helicase)